MANWALDDRVKLLHELVEINSGTGNQKGVRQVQHRVGAELTQLGFELEFLPPITNSDSSSAILIATLNGKQKDSFHDGSTEKGRTSSDCINLVTHADTVFEPESGFLQFDLKESEGIATGPGVIDDKGGIVVALEGVRRFLMRLSSLKTQAHVRPQIRFICTPTEEIGSPGLISHLQKLGGQSQIVLGFEPSLEDGSIIESRRGNLWYDIQVFGREGHAGRDHAQSVNAAHELAFKLTQLHSLTDYERDITVSTGQIGGGSKFNIICGHAYAKVDIRFSSFEARAEVLEKVKNIVHTSYIGANNKGEKPSARFSIADDCPPFSKSTHSEPYLKKYLEIISSIEHRSIRSVKSGGAADSNYMSRPGLIVLDGLGATGGGMHRKDEFITLSSLESRSEALARFLEFFVVLKKSSENLKTTP